MGGIALFLERPNQILRPRSPDRGLFISRILLTGLPIFLTDKPPALQYADAIVFFKHYTSPEIVSLLDLSVTITKITGASRRTESGIRQLWGRSAKPTTASTARRSGTGRGFPWILSGRLAFGTLRPSQVSTEFWGIWGTVSAFSRRDRAFLRRPGTQWVDLSRGSQCLRMYRGGRSGGRSR